MVKERMPFASQRIFSLRVLPSFTPITRAATNSKMAAMANRIATPLKGGVPRNPIWMTAQVVPQMRQTRPKASVTRSVAGRPMPCGRVNGYAARRAPLDRRPRSESRRSSSLAREPRTPSLAQQEDLAGDGAGGVRVTFMKPFGDFEVDDVLSRFES